MPTSTSFAYVESHLTFITFCLSGLNRTYMYDIQLTAYNTMGRSPPANVTIAANPIKPGELIKNLHMMNKDRFDELIM